MIARRLACFLIALLLIAPAFASAAEPWIEPMRKVHAAFKGTPGTFAQFGDSITVTMAFWAGLEGNPKNMNAGMAEAHRVVKGWMKPECWRGWKGPEFGSNGGMTVRWALENVDSWLAKLNPEVALIMFGSNDLKQMELAEYEAKLRQVVEHCLANGTVVILSTMPPRSGQLEKSRQFSEAARRIAASLKVPLTDYQAAILERRPDDWDGSQFKEIPGGDYEVPTLISRDGVHPSNPAKYANDYSIEALRTHGFGLRNYLCLLACGDVIANVLQP